jgi:hypothetical protein
MWVAAATVQRYNHRQLVREQQQEVAPPMHLASQMQGRLANNSSSRQRCDVISCWG